MVPHRREDLRWVVPRCREDQDGWYHVAEKTKTGGAMSHRRPRQVVPHTGGKTRGTTETLADWQCP